MKPREVIGECFYCKNPVEFRDGRKIVKDTEMVYHDECLRTQIGKTEFLLDQGGGFFHIQVLVKP